MCHFSVGIPEFSNMHQGMCRNVVVCPVAYVCVQQQLLHECLLECAVTIVGTCSVLVTMRTAVAVHVVC